jgi:hypothetical protein
VLHRAVTRRVPLVTLMVAVVVLSACSSSDSKSKKKTKSGTGARTTATTGPSVTLNPDPTACMRGSFRFTRMDYDGLVQPAFGPTTIVGGIAGRRIELKPDNTFHFTDDGRTRVQFTLHQPTGGTTGTAVLTAQADGTYLPTSSVATFNITALTGTLALVL